MEGIRRAAAAGAGRLARCQGGRGSSATCRVEAVRRGFRRRRPPPSSKRASVKGGRGDRPAGVTALGLLFMAGAAISFTSVLSLLFPGGPLEPMWRLNPRAREAFASMGPWAIALMATVCAACAFSAAGLWTGARWGYRLAIALLTVNLVGDTANALPGVEPRAAIGVPIVGAILVFLLANRRVRSFFRDATEGARRRPL